MVFDILYYCITYLNFIDKIKIYSNSLGSQTQTGQPNYGIKVISMKEVSFTQSQEQYLIEVVFEKKQIELTQNEKSNEKLLEEKLKEKFEDRVYEIEDPYCSKILCKYVVVSNSQAYYYIEELDSFAKVDYRNFLRKDKLNNLYLGSSKILESNIKIEEFDDISGIFFEKDKEFVHFNSNLSGKNVKIILYGIQYNNIGDVIE